MMRDRAELGIKHVWMHQSYRARQPQWHGHGLRGEHGITVIDGGRPLMFEPTADLGHRVMRVIYRSHVPKTV